MRLSAIELLSLAPSGSNRSTVALPMAASRMISTTGGTKLATRSPHAWAVHTHRWSLDFAVIAHRSAMAIGKATIAWRETNRRGTRNMGPATAHDFHPHSATKKVANIAAW